MTILGISKPLEEQSKARQQMTQGLLIGGSFAGAGSVVFAAFELIRAHPDKGFSLLEKWGPWFFLAMFCVWVLNGLANRGLDVFSAIGERFAGSMDRIADEQEKLSVSARDTADAMTRSADRDDRDHERMATLVDHSGQQSRQALEAVTAMHPTLDAIAAYMKAQAEKERV